MSTAKNYKELLEEYNFHWDSSEEIWVRKEGFGRKSTIDVMFKCLFVMTKNKDVVFSHFIESFGEFSEIIRKHYY